MPTQINRVLKQNPDDLHTVVGKPHLVGVVVPESDNAFALHFRWIEFAKPVPKKFKHLNVFGIGPIRLVSETAGTAVTIDQTVEIESGIGQPGTTGFGSCQFQVEFGAAVFSKQADDVVTAPSNA